MEEAKKALDTSELERRESRRLIEQGVEFTVPKKSFLKYFSREKERSFIIREPFLGVKLLINDEILSIDYDERRLFENPIEESKHITRPVIKAFSRIIAMSVLDSRLMIKLFTPILSFYFLGRLKESKVVQIAQLIIHLQNYGDFISSIRILASQPRVTAPNRVEEEPQA